MVIIGGKNILEVPSFCGTEAYGSKKAQVSLEEQIRADFGEDGLTRFKEHNVQVTVPLNDPEFKLDYHRRGNLLKELEDKRVIGKVYQLGKSHLSEVSADNVQTMFTKYSDGSSNFSMIFDLNPATETERYLKLLFSDR